MENSLYNPDVTENILGPAGTLLGFCYSKPYLLDDAEEINNNGDIVTWKNQCPHEAALMIIPVALKQLKQIIAAPDQYFCWQHPRVRLAINYEALKACRLALPEITNVFQFWLLDFAPPGADWRLIDSFPFSGIVLSEDFFNTNYQKFTFPFLLSSFAEREIKVIVRSPQPVPPDEVMKTLNISGWQQQRRAGSLIC
ncbi:hypothetical protein PANNVG_03239 [Pantoea sp. Nvir]|uniref:hypothetical protein n=1 Tax=unclassified Pantoea TaxID=2630326 RepID=UPI0025F5C153|nr:hypothetical protein [Pantoea sp.]